MIKQMKPIRRRVMDWGGGYQSKLRPRSYLMYSLSTPFCGWGGASLPQRLALDLADAFSWWDIKELANLSRVFFQCGHRRGPNDKAEARHASWGCALPIRPPISPQQILCHHLAPGSSYRFDEIHRGGNPPLTNRVSKDNRQLGRFGDETNVFFESSSPCFQPISSSVGLRPETLELRNLGVFLIRGEWFRRGETGDGSCGSGQTNGAG